MNKSLLILDDDQMILNLLGDFFVAEGYDVISCTSASKALDELSKNKIPVVISDLSMPEMDGVEFCKKLRESNPITVVIALTGFHKLFEISACRSIGFDDYLKKPVDLKIILKVVDDGYDKVCRWLGRT